jgi:hypothetical protein
MQKGRIPAFNLTLGASVKKTADPQMAHLVFADTRANTHKTKRAIFCNRMDRLTELKK